VDGGHGSCTRSPAPTAYNSSRACDTFDRAYHAAANGGDTVTVKCGTYGSQRFTADNSKTGGTTTFQPATPFCVTIAGSNAAAVDAGAASFLTLRSFVINSATPPSASYCGIVDTSATGSALSRNVTIDGNRINVGHVLGGCSSILLHAAQNWTIVNNTIGPSCCGADAPASPVGITIGKPNSAAPDCTTEACNITINNNLFQYILDDAAYWPSSGFGSAPEAACTNHVLCHLDAVHIWGAQNVTIDYNRFYGDQCMDVFVESQNNALNANYDIIGNAATALAGQCNGSLAMDVVGPGWAGTFNIKFNSLAAQANLTFNTMARATFNIVGNYGRWYTANSTGAGAGCTGGNPPNITFLYRYNAWTNGVRCDPTDVAAVAAWINPAAAPAVGLDMHLSGSAGALNGMVPTSVAGGCPSTGIDGGSRVQGAVCGAGAFP
jgi:hypothetical protein